MQSAVENDQQMRKKMNIDKQEHHQGHDSYSFGAQEAPWQMRVASDITGAKPSWTSGIQNKDNLIASWLGHDDPKDAGPRSSSPLMAFVYFDHA